MKSRPAAMGSVSNLWPRIEASPDQIPFSRGPALFFTNLQGGDALNSPQWGGPGTNMSNLAKYGVINSSTGWRTVMTSLRVRF